MPNHVDTPRPHTTAAQRPGRAARTAVIVAAALLAVTAALTPGVSAATTSAAAGPDGAPAPSCALASAPPLAVDYPGQAPPAGAILRRLANQLRTVTADAQTGRYAYAGVRMQAADSTLEGPCVETVTAYADEQHWRADGGSGRITGTPCHHDPTDPPPLDTATYPAGGLAGVVAGPVPTHPAALAAALDAAFPPIDVALTQTRPLRAEANVRQCRHSGAATRLRAVAELNAWHYTNRAARRAVLLVLADVVGLSYRGAVAGHPGAIAISADSGDWRDLLVLDPNSGVVLAYEQVLLRNGHQLGVHTPYSNARITYADRGRSSRAGRVSGRPRDA